MVDEPFGVSLVSFVQHTLPGRLKILSAAVVHSFGRHQSESAVSVLGIVVAAAYMLKVIRQVLLGPLNERWAGMPDISVRELVSITPLLLIILALGVYPRMMLELQDGAIQQLIARVIGV